MDGESDRNGPAPRANIYNHGLLPTSVPRINLVHCPLDEQLRFRSWNENTRVHVEIQPVELLVPCNISKRLAAGSADEMFPIRHAFAGGKSSP